MKWEYQNINARSFTPNAHLDKCKQRMETEHCRTQLKLVLSKDELNHLTRRGAALNTLQGN